MTAFTTPTGMRVTAKVFRVREYIDVHKHVSRSVHDESDSFLPPRKLT